MNKDYSDSCHKLLDEYLEWQKDNFLILQSENNCKFITPFLNPIHDNMELTVEKTNTNYIKITDKAKTINFLYHEGVNLGYFASQRSKTQDIFKNILKEAELIEENNEIFVLCPITKFPIYFHKMIEVILSIYRLMHLAKPVSFEKSFFEICKDFFIKNKKSKFENNFKASTSMGEFNIDFVFSNGKYKFIDALHPIDESRRFLRLLAESQAYKWIKLSEDKKYDFIPSAIYDNRKIEWSEIPINILKDQSDYIFGWDEKDKILSLL